MADDRVSGPTEFETLIARARAGEVSRADVMLAFLDTMVVVPSGSDFAGGRGTLQPVQVERAGVTWMAVYTSLEGAKQVGHIAPLRGDAAGIDHSCRADARQRTGGQPGRDGVRGRAVAGRGNPAGSGAAPRWIGRLEPFQRLGTADRGAVTWAPSMRRSRPTGR